MNIKEGIEKRFSVRAFTKEVPDMKLISEILNLFIIFIILGYIWIVFPIKTNSTKYL